MAGVSSASKSATTSIDRTLENKITTLLNQLNFTYDETIPKPDNNLFKRFPEIIGILQQLKQYLSEKSNDSSLFSDDMKNIYRLLDCLTQEENEIKAFSHIEVKEEEVQPGPQNMTGI
ncbi:Hypothetical predicted protein [Octopus vulgaris]|uniref:Uncharacterized protein n=1 Tax=Octopus vulgaris TaxID=6645 RepID=A0AA36BDT9_OCTVU|nr:Hypothetical predicted protein [Octopus vulgaris]